MENYLIIWPKSENVVHINYHYTQFGECVDYLDKYFPGQIIPIDGDIEGNIDITKFIQENGIKKVIIQVNYENAINAFEMARKIKEENNIPILAYGNVTTMLPELFADSEFDAMFRDGDAEVCMKSFLRDYDLEKDSDILQEQLEGMTILDDGKVIKTRNGKYISENNWGISRQDRVPVKEYDARKGKNRYVLNMSRGCPFGCEHCLIQLTEGRMERRRSIENTKESIEQIKDQYKHIKIWAANFTLDKDYVIKFCEMMKKDFPDMTWECATRIDLINDRELLRKMFDAGCRQISLGIESLNNKELINTKDFKTFEIARTISTIQEAGITVKGCIMLGMPNQTKQSIVNTLSFLRSRNVLIRPTVYTPYHNLRKVSNVEELSKYNRKTYENDNVEGITSEQLISLVKDPYHYEQILGIERIEENER